LKIEPPEEDFDPETFDLAARKAAIDDGLSLFNAGDFYGAHECFERCWLAAEGASSDFWKGLVQASICLYHLNRKNIEGASKLHTGMRRLLAPFLPQHEGFDLQRLMSDMQAHIKEPSGSHPLLWRVSPSGQDYKSPSA